VGEGGSLKEPAGGGRLAHGILKLLIETWKTGAVLLFSQNYENHGIETF